jgi:hypothetical protein
VTTLGSAPTIPGLVYKGFLGSGGFADVYLYQSTSPIREVAVKVLHSRVLSEPLVRQFAEEANTMAALEHPYVVRVYSSGLTTDGRPYIEMAYYADETLVQALDKGPLPVADVLRIGVQLASAIEAAHRVGLLHRDIKPANVLIDRFGDPALTDFGVASHLHEADDQDASLSVPWAPPEAMFATAPLDRRGDVYSLAATLWHLLVGHSPFEVPGGDNRPTALMVRIRDLPVPPTGRADVPDTLERLLRQSMSNEPRLRPASAEDFARVLNAIEEEVRLRPTPFKVARASSRTARAKPPAGVPAVPATRLRPATAAPPPPGTPGIPADATRRRDAALPDEPAGSRKVVVWGIGLLVLVAAGVTAWVVLGPDPDERPAPLPTPSQDSELGIALTPPGAPVVTGVVVGAQVTFTWQYDYAAPGDISWVVTGTGAAQRLAEPTLSLPYDGHEVCIEVRIARASGGQAQTQGTRGCAP